MTMHSLEQRIYSQPHCLFPFEEGKVDGQDISKGVSFHVVCMTFNPFAAQMNPWNADAGGIIMVP